MDIPSIGKINFLNAIPLFNFKIGFQASDELKETNMEADMFVSFLLGKLLLLLLLIGWMQVIMDQFYFLIHSHESIS